jgi:hypothetical protein
MSVFDDAETAGDSRQESCVALVFEAIALRRSSALPASDL